MLDPEDGEADEANELDGPAEAPMSIDQILGLLEDLLGAEIIGDPDPDPDLDECADGG